jgi:hypothetical protein
MQDLHCESRLDVLSVTLQLVTVAELLTDYTPCYVVEFCSSRSIHCSDVFCMWTKYNNVLIYFYPAQSVQWPAYRLNYRD